MRVIGQDEVRARLTFEVCIPIMRQAMIAFSRGETRQLLRSIIPLDQGRMFGVMPGALGERACFGAKLVSVFPENFALGRQSHQGVVVLFDGESGVPICVAHAGEITAIRTAAASAAATDALARPEAHRLALLGYGEQARTHLRAISRVRALSDVRVWGRDFGRAQAFAAEMSVETGLRVRAVAGAQAAVEEADIICTLTSSKTPVLLGAWVAPGAHLNLVGSSYAGPVEVDHDQVLRARLIADSREGVLAQGAEVLAAKAAGLIDDAHVVGEIGEVFDGRLAGRQSPDQITAYKSLGHIVQDLASAQALMER
ncbi:MAG: ornithine cyclodeaminase family protein [Phenylobacterium sp.]|uniref:ornithine cyclodeaminase family protein n=1 Tax=Phenylobacterium sp. TaxID=1871053 RepID=UPI002733B5EC|nr:ornithine cyclodeaminase family protein [Phenylobacterium sp.]MDP1641411.1 ornithine cyclodeaminase family protein [Phenylobacterium sp.]MDP3118651.1 ornithine cyclodeaminase family protein [Phenylobacterium sp.]